MRRTRRIASLAALGLLVQSGVALDALTAAPAAAAESAPSQQTPNASTTEAPDEASALLAARLNKRRIEVTGARTETSTVWANPDGTLSQDMSAGPIRMKVGEAWVPLDTTLVETGDGKVAPKAHPEGLVFSGGDAAVKVGDALPGTGTPTASPSATPTGSAAPSTSASPSPSAAKSTAPPSAAASPSAGISSPAAASSTPAASPSASAGEHASRSLPRLSVPAADPASAPSAAPAEQELVKVGSGDAQVELGWQGKLPKPKLSGSTATYTDARPGVDLVLEATRTGFEQYLVVKDRSAISQAGTLTLPLDTTGYRVERQDDGSIRLTDPSGGRPAVRIPAPAMWDAAVDAGSGEHLHRGAVSMELKGGGADAQLVFTPDAAFLADTRTQFPVTVDPAVDFGTSFDTFVQKGISSDQSSATELKLGTYDGGTTVARSFLHFPVSGLKGRQILGAKLNLYNFHSWSCSAADWQVVATNPASTDTRWTAQPYWGDVYATSNETRDTDTGSDSHQCTNGDGSGWVKADVTSMVAAWAGNGTDTGPMGLRAASESSNAGWKRFYSAQGAAPPYLSVTYNTPPPTPATVDVLPSVPGSPAYTSSATPRFQVLAADDDGGTVGVNIDLWRGSTFVNGIYRNVPAGSYVQLTPADLGVAKLDEATNYGVWARVSDANSQSGWVGTQLVVDTVKPGAPFITSPTYPADGLWHGAAGTAGQFTFTPPAGTDDLIAFVYTLDGASAVTVNATQVLTTSITPATDGHHVLKVQAKDRAGNLSDPATYQFQVGRAGLSSPVEGTQAAKRVKLSVDAQADLKRVVYQYRRGPGATEYDVPLANLTKADNTPVTDPKPRLSDLGTHANWTVIDTLGNVGGVVQIRALMFPEDGSGAGVATGWNTITVDRNADGAASAEIGAGSVNLLTGDYSVGVTDADEAGMSVARSSSSRDLARGWQPQGERLTLNQRQVGVDTAGFTPGQAIAERSTARGHDNSTDSLRVVPASSGWDSYAALGPEYTMGQGMKPGHVYRLTTWVYVPAATGLDTSALPNRGLRVVGVFKTGAGYGDTASGKASFTDGWQQLTLDMAVPKDATEAWFRLYNGNVGGSGKEVFFDDISLKEIVAPFGPQWAGGPDAGTGSEYRSLSFPESDLAEIRTTDNGFLTFAKGSDGTFFPEPGAESLTLKSTPVKSGALVNSSGKCLEVPGGTPGNGSPLQAAACTGAPNQQWTYGDDLSLRVLGYCLDNPWGATADNTALTLWSCGVSVNQQWEVRPDKTVANRQSGKCLDAYQGATIWVCWNGPNQIWDVQTSGTGYTLSDLDGSSTVFSRQAGSDVYGVASESGPEAASTTRYIYDSADGRALPKRAIATVEPGVDDGNKCTLDPLPRGCDVMDYDYATATTAVAGTPGDFTDRIRSVKVWSWNPATSKQEAVEVTRYLYDEQGRLVQVWDPRLAQPLKTAYTYDAAGRVTRIAPAGELPWDFDYGQAAGDPDAGRLLKVRRGTLAAGSKSQVNGEIATKVVYNVPLTRGAGGPYEMAGADVAQWAQTDAPTDATAVFGPEDEPGTHSATSTAPGKDGYKPATVHYLNASGNEVNTATPSVLDKGDIDTSEYDRYGNVVRALDATNRSIALGTHPDAARFAAELNLPAASADRARLLDSRTTYTPDGLDVLETLGPLYRATLSEDMAGQSNPVSVTSEAETLPQLGATAPIKMDADCCGLTWSGGAQLGLRGTAAGAEDSVRVSVPEEGTYLLSGQMTKNSDHGIVRFSIDGTNLGSPIDQYSATAAVAPFNTGTPIQLARGDHTLKITVTGTNAATGGERYHAGLDTLTLTKTTVNPTVKAGTPVLARDHNTNTYDEGKPDGQAYHLVTTATDGARIDGYAQDAELRVTKNGYGTPIGGTSGWTLKTATSVTTDAAAGGANLTATVKFDASGRALESRKPGASGTDASTVKTVFYTAGANPDDAACGNRPEWAGSPCTTGPGGAITGADAARMPTTLPVKRVTRYSRFGEAEEVTEINAGKSRTAVTVYDGADRIVSAQITSDQGLALPQVTTEYDPATGDIVKTTAGGKSLTRVLDALGRLISYTDADGATTTTEFDKYGKPTKVTDPTGSTTYTYDRAKEPRGLVTSVNDSVAGEFTAKYGPDGQLVEQTYPGGIVRKDTFNAVGEATGRTYTRTSDSAVIWSQAVDVSTQGVVATDASSTATRTYTYDRLGRLTRAQQSTVTTGCVTRQYAFDAHSNRLAKSTSPSAGNGDCATDSPITETHTYDSADRLTDPGFTYDAFGRTATTGTGSTNTYWANDKAASQQKGDDKQTWQIDPAHRFTAFTTEKKQADGSWANATSKLNHYGDDSDEVRWTVEDTTQGTLTRNVSGPDTDLVATTSKTGDITLQLTNLFGSVVVTTDTALTKPVVLDFDEFGIPQAGQAGVRYGWLGGKQRSAEALDGDILMGARLYSPALGRFLQTDPVPGGNASPYDYCTGDPINCTDLDGNWGMPKWLKKTVQVVAKVAEVASYIPGPIGGIAAAVSSVSYAATGNWSKAAEMAVTAVAATVGANTAVKSAVTAVKATRAAGRVGKVASRARSVFRSKPTQCLLGNSFTPESLVLMADGTYLPIGEIQVGDHVSATDPETGAIAAEPILDVIVGYGNRHLVAIGVDGSDAQIVATSNHPFWIDGKGWVQAGEVKLGDQVMESSGIHAAVTFVQDIGDTPGQLVFNLNVGGLHTFTVADGEGSEALVHNCSGHITGIDMHHIRAGHRPLTRYPGKSKFKNSSASSIRRMVKTAIKQGKRYPNDERGGHVHIYDFGRAIGQDRNGRTATAIKVVVRKRKVVTAYPIRIGGKTP
ncbi:DNRLRE domain-containing protein [Kitasatospora sp. NPDC090308]|uniref:DNRLRE domain-containing protein n=1 Tax=Kitasatospora sp. NPDC090308 TaxID=3364082 RepID=UPI00382F7A99